MRQARHLAVLCCWPLSRSRLIQWATFREYETSSASDCLVWLVPFTISANSVSNIQRVLRKLGLSSEQFSEIMKQAWHLTVQCGWSSSRCRLIQWETFRNYEASSASDRPVWLMTFTISANPVSNIQRVWGKLSIWLSSVVGHIYNLG